jgi:hypothetical protein
MKKLIKLTNPAKYGIDFDFLVALSQGAGKPIFKVNNEIDAFQESATHATDILENMRRRRLSTTGEDGVVLLQKAIDELEMTKQRIILSRKLQKAHAAWEIQKDDEEALLEFEQKIKEDADDMSI